MMIKMLNFHIFSRLQFAVDRTKNVLNMYRTNQLSVRVKISRVFRLCWKYKKG